MEKVSKEEVEYIAFCLVTASEGDTINWKNAAGSLMQYIRQIEGPTEAKGEYLSGGVFEMPPPDPHDMGLPDITEE